MLKEQNKPETREERLARIKAAKVAEARATLGKSAPRSLGGETETPVRKAAPKKAAAKKTATRTSPKK